MTADSSALVAIVFAEPGERTLIERIGHAEIVRVGAPTMVETGLVLSRRFGQRAEPRLQRLVRELDLLIVPFTEEH